MAEIRPFKGFLYDKSKIGGDYSGVMAPPYDVIPESMRDELYEKNSYNVIRLILGKPFEDDNEENNKYTRAKRFLDEWQQEGILEKDRDEAFYVYLQEYMHKGEKYRRLGFIGLMNMDDPILRHEYTLAKPKEDRLNLIKQVKSNLSPIFTLFNDSEGNVTEVLEKAVAVSVPVIDVEIESVRHKFFRITDEASIKKIVDGLSDKKVFIADGHHRYEVAKTYRDMRRKEEGYDGSADHIMIYFTDLGKRDNLTVMPTHRAVKVMPFANDGELMAKMSGHFDVTEYSGLSELVERLEEEEMGGHAFGYFGGEKYLLLKSKDKKSLMELIPEEKSEEWKLLDVSVLHAAVFKNILSVKNEEGNITYVRDPESAVDLIEDGSHMAAFFLNSTRVEQLKTVAEKGEMMPQKSTYFYPKLLSGLVINKFDA